MNYQVLARKWRPHKFEDMVGQEHVLRALTNALDNNRLHHAYLFTGTRGVGKTTVARIFAKSLNCESGVSSTPCGECSTCLDIDAGRFFDLIEVDAASRTKVEQTRELLENVPYAPSSGRYKVYLIDEVHMFSDHSFNALLKTLEEPPEHVKFLLATTEPKKVPVTVLSRCLQFSLKRLPERQISNYLKDIMSREACSAEESALAHISRAADGSMRDALSLMDQAIAYGQGKVLANEVERMLGRPSPDRVLELVFALADGNAQKVMNLVAELAEYSPDFSGLLADILSVLHQIALLQGVPNVQNTSNLNPQRLRELADIISAEDVQLFYQIGLIGRRDIALTSDMREGFEMMLLRMLAFRPHNEHSEQTIESASQAVKTTQNNAKNTTDVSNELQVSTDTGTVNQDISSSIGNVAVSPVEPTQFSRHEQVAAIKAKLSGESRKQKSEKKTNQRTELIVQSNQYKSDKTTQVVSPHNLKSQGWNQFVATLAVTGLTEQLLNHCIVKSTKDKSITVVLEKRYESLLQPSSVRQVESALLAYYGHAVALDISIEEGDLDTPARQKQQTEQARLQSARDSIAADPIVQKLCRSLDASVQEDSIKPIKPLSEDQPA